MWLLNDFLSFKSDVQVHSKSNKQKNLEKTSFFLTSRKPMTKKAGSGAGSGAGSEFVTQFYGFADPDLMIRSGLDSNYPSQTFATKPSVSPITHLNPSAFTTDYLTIGIAYLLAPKNLGTGTVYGYESIIPFSISYMYFSSEGGLCPNNYFSVIICMLQKR